MGWGGIGRLRGCLSYANVAATLALFLALGGGAAVAAGQIGAKDLAPDSVYRPGTRTAIKWTATSTW